ncbi:MAG: transcription elongation factor GreA [Dehalococcoidia bacterium]|nr:MAG: transcription elongation factor GreA [Dehalococcoidia bacterium]
MALKETFLTPEGLEKLKAELEHLETVRRPQVAEQIHRAKELGGTVDNAEYDDAKNEQAFVEGRILTLESMIKSATLIKEGKSPSSFVKLGSKVRVRNQDGEEEHYTIVGSAEASPSEGRISNESPVGSALLGKRVGDEVKAEAPAGTLKLKLIAIE